MLDAFCTACGSSGEFGYRMQAVFAHVLRRLGATILEVNAHGHPDVKAELAGRRLAVQVKTILHRHEAAQLVLSREDLAGIRSTIDGEGFLAVLDCAMPVGWMVIPEKSARLLVDRAVHVATLRAEQVLPLSSDCTDVFLDLVITEKDRLPHLQFGVLAQRALRGEPL